jgi:hypothetical protein
MRPFRTFAAPLLLAAPLPVLVGMPALAQVGTYPAPSRTDADRLADAIRRVGAAPRDLNALIEAGELSVKVGDATAAASLFKRAEQIDPNNGRVKAGIARILVNGEHPGEALRYFALAERNGLSMTPYAADRGLAFDLIGEQERAQRDYRLALRQGDDDEVRRRYALSLGIAGKQKEALEEIDALLRKSDRGAWRARAFILAMNGDVAGANKIATSMMPPGMATGLAAFFQRLPTLSAADRAFAVHFGEVTPTPARLADARLAPVLPPLGADPDAPRPVQVAAAAPVPQPAATGRDRRRGRDRDTRRQVAAASVATTARPTVGAFPTRAAPVVTGRGTGGAGVVPTQVATTPAPLPSRPLTPTPTPRSSPSPAVAAATRPTPQPGSSTVAPAATPAAQPAAVAAVTSPAPARSAALGPAVTNLPREGSALAATAMTPSATPIPGVVPAVSTTPAPPTTVAARAAPATPALTSVRPVTRPANPAPATPPPADNDSVLARIVANIVVPESELAAAPVRPAAPATRSGSLDQAARKAERNVAAQRNSAAKPAAVAEAEEPVDKPLTAAQRRAKARADAAAEKAAADKPLTAAERRAKALADRKAKEEAAEKKALAAKEAAEKKAAKAEPARYWVQVAGGKNKGDLDRAWSDVQKKASALKGKAAFTTPLKATNRVVTGPYKTEAEARAMVNTLAKQGVSAFTFASEAGQKMTKIGGK